MTGLRPIDQTPASGKTPLRAFLHTETGGAAVLLAAAIAALVWVNADAHSYDSLWTTRLAVEVGHTGIAMDLRDWVNAALMTFFFFVVGLEARREFDLGELRERRRSLPAVLASVGGMSVAIAIYLAFNAGHPSAHGWGTAMSTDTAFALGLLALIGPRFSERLRAFLLTASVVDDVIALVVIATVYSSGVDGAWLAAALIPVAGVLVARRLDLRNGLVVAGLGAAAWVCVYESGVDPVIVGLALGLSVYAYSAPRERLERATERFREFREQPTAELARSAELELRDATPFNERLQQLFHPWTSYVVVPLFALANAGISLRGGFLTDALTSRVTLGILVGLVVGKPLGYSGAARIVLRLSRGRLRAPVGWASIAADGTIAGVGFTVSLLVATLAFSGRQLEEAKLGILLSAGAASALTWLVFRAVARLPRRTRVRAIFGTSEPLVDLAIDVDPERDHIRGPRESAVTLVEYGDFECPYCGRAEPIVRELLAEFTDIRYVWRHMPLSDVHPHAQLAAEASEAAAAQGAFWELHDLLLVRQDRQRLTDLVGYAGELGLDVERFEAELRDHVHAARVADDVEGADQSAVNGTPTFFINGRRHYGAYDIDTLSRAVRTAGARAWAAQP